MRNIKCTIEYDGSKFIGWQIQPSSQRTVQGEIIKAWKKVSGETIKLIGSGRTDTGVHALGQVANFKTKSSLPIESIKNALNAKLPKDIVILEAKEVKGDFHAQYSAKRKTYRYVILNREDRPGLMNNYCLHFPHKLNLSAMRKEAKSLKGKKDFKTFQSSDPKRKTKSTVRTIKRIEIKKSQDTVSVEIEADGFLYKMVRNIVGTLLETGTGKRPAGNIKEILTKKDRKLAGPTAKPDGLYLVKVQH